MIVECHRYRCVEPYVASYDSTFYVSDRASSLTPGTGWLADLRRRCQMWSESTLGRSYRRPASPHGRCQPQRWETRVTRPWHVDATTCRDHCQRSRQQASGTSRHVGTDLRCLCLSQRLSAKGSKSREERYVRHMKGSSLNFVRLRPSSRDPSCPRSHHCSHGA